MVALDLGDLIKQLANGFKTLFPGNPGKLRIHPAPLAIFAVYGFPQVLSCAAYALQVVI